jgi:hypothetical protein
VSAESQSIELGVGGKEEVVGGGFVGIDCRFPLFVFLLIDGLRRLQVLLILQRDDLGLAEAWVAYLHLQLLLRLTLFVPHLINIILPNKINKPFKSYQHTRRILIQDSTAGALHLVGRQYFMGTA